MEYYARPSQDGFTFQALREHILNVSDAASIMGQRVGLGQLCKLVGLLHDMGKYSTDFQLYIRRLATDIQYGQKIAPSNVDHGVYGAAYLTKYIEGLILQQPKQKPLLVCFREIAAMCICYHHGGLEDYIRVDGTRSPLLDRISGCRSGEFKQEPLESVQEKYFSEVITRESFGELTLQAFHEFGKILQMAVLGPEVTSRELIQLFFTYDH